MQILVTPKQKKQVERQAENFNVSQSEVIRTILDQYYAS